MLSPRHAPIPDSGPGVEQHWGYFSRQLPCTSDPGKCAYLDVVYHSHDLSVLYSAILWAVLLGIVLLCFVGHYLCPIGRQISDNDEPEHPIKGQSSLYRGRRFFSAVYARHFLREALTPLFGHTTRFNILLLVILVGYLTIFTFVGIVYKTWRSPVEGSPDTIRVGFGPWADRIGVLAYALTPLAVLLCTRESLLSLLTGIPYHHFNFLHRWLGYIIYIQSVLHTIGWTVVEGKLYQPQPTTWNEFIGQEYIIWGIVAMIFLTFLVVFSTRWAIRWTGYEFFRKAHYVVAMLYVGACWGHWSKLACWMIASLAVWGLDRGVRLIRTIVLHVGRQSGKKHASWGLLVPKAQITSFPSERDGDVVRLDFTHDHRPWAIGQHFYLCFPELSVWQAHPMTPCSVPCATNSQTHTYIIRAKTGITKRLATQAQLTATAPSAEQQPSTPIVLSGPYGQPIADDDLHCTDDINLFCVAGGTGVTFVLPLLQGLAATDYFSSRRSMVEFVWIVRHQSDMQWISPELDALRTVAERCPHFRIRVFVTRDSGSSSDFSADTPTTVTINEPKRDIEKQENNVSDLPPPSFSDAPFSIHCLRPAGTASESSMHPDMCAYLKSFVSRTVRGPTRAIASGPAGLVSSLRDTIAELNDPAQVWRGNERYDVEFVYDDRLEW